MTFRDFEAQTKGNAIFNEKHMNYGDYFLPEEYNIVGAGCIINGHFGDGQRGTIILVSEDEINEWAIYRLVEETRCSCGARHTSFKDKHMFYCDLYVEE